MVIVAVIGRWVTNPPNAVADTCSLTQRSGRVRLRAAHVLVVKMSARAAPPERWVGGWRLHFLTGLPAGTGRWLEAPDLAT